MKISLDIYNFADRMNLNKQGKKVSEGLVVGLRFILISEALLGYIT